MAYMEEQAQERERIRQQMLGGQRPGAIGQEDPNAPAPQGVQIPTNATELLGALQQFLSQALTPKGVKVDQVKDLEVPMMIPGRPPPPEPERWRGGDVDVGGAISAMFDKAKGSALQDMLRRSQQPGADVRARSTSGAAERAQRVRDTTPGPYAKGAAATTYVQDKIPGLKPGIDAATAEPGRPAAEAYLQQQRTDIPPIRMEEKGGGTGYKADLQYLNDHGGHATVMKDGKKENVPLGTKGNYGDINPELAARLRAAGELYEKETGKKPVYGESSRGEDVQKTYWEDSAHGTKYPAAPPGRSRHQTGDAMDLPGEGGFQQWLTDSKNGDRVGLHFPVKGDAPHVQVNPKHAQTFAKPDGPPLPAWDKGLPQVDAKTNWPDPSATTPADTITAKPVDTGPGGGDKVLADQRAGYKAEADANPTFRERAAAIMISESSTAEGQQGTFEAMLNRVKANNRPLNDAIDPNYHADYMVRNSSKFDAALDKIKNNPQLREQVYSLQDKAFAGSNVSKLATDYASKGVADNSAKTSTETYASPDGQRFFRKDLNPVEDGPGQVAANQKWHKETSEAMARPTQPAAGPDAGTVAVAPATSQSSVNPSEVAQIIAPKEPSPAEVFAGDVPVPTEGQPTAAADAPLPAATPTPAATTPSPPPAAAAPAPPPPPPRPAAPPPPPPRPAPAAPAPAPQPTGLSRAHAILDMTAGQFVSKFAPEHLGKVKSFGYENTPMREMVRKPFVGSQIIDGLAPHMADHGFTMQDFQKAITQPSPTLGKRSEGTSGSTDFSARARTPMAPPGLDEGRVPLPQERPATAPNFDPGSQPAVQNANGEISTVRTMGFEDNGKQVNVPSVPAEGGRIMSNQEAFDRYKETGRHLGKFDSIEEANTAAEALHQAEAQQISQAPKGAQPLPPSLAEALVESVKDQGRPPLDMKPNPEALPVLPATQVAPPQPGAPGGLGLAPPGLDLTAPGAGPFQTAMGAPGSQGGAIATLGMLPPIQNSTFSTPLLDQQAAQPSVGYGNLAPIPWNTLGGWGWNTGGSGGGFDFGGGGGFDMGGGGAASMFSGSSGLFPMPMTWGG